MRRLALFAVLFAFVAASFFGCDETAPTEPRTTATSKEARLSHQHPVMTESECTDGQVLLWSTSDDDWVCETPFRPSKKLDILASMPYFSGNFWQVIAANPTSAARELQIYALCATVFDNALSTYLVHRVVFVPADGTPRSYGALCSDGGSGKLTGGGFYILKDYVPGGY